MVIRDKIETHVRPKYFKRKTIEGFKLLKTLGEQYYDFRINILKKKVVSVFKRIVKFKKQKRG